MTHKVMLVEDDRPILEMMDLLIRRLSYEPVLMPDGNAALEVIRRDPPALILLDIMMVPIDGWTFLKRLRELPGMQDLPVILFTAAPEVGERMMQIRDPHVSVLHKPVSLDVLKETIVKYLPAG
ncbi:response regulator [Methanoregula sp.]|uniref:response regulator n=1 Tax=Methanoregula sp. TaxID=2052170 RepID=UPI002621A20E|nr:response regulator [Methanoregula sp.]MDD5142080.1 response regulator [Methanoregula sp.]